MDHKSKRRSFLKSTLSATAPLILPSSVWGAKIKPNDRIVMGFIGMGKQNAGLLNNFMSQGIQAVAAVSYTHLRAHETDSYLVCRLLLEKKKT